MNFLRCERLLVKTHNNGQWTAARFHSFIKSALRRASVRWPPISRVRKKSWVKRGVYKCAGYKKSAHNVPVSFMRNDKRVNNIYVDHIKPVVPTTGFVSWDNTIQLLFCEDEDLQVLCYDCHNNKTSDERGSR